MPVNPRLLRLCRSLIVASAAMLMTAGTALAGSWAAREVRGTVLFLSGNKWEDVASGQVFPGNVVIRTLGTGRVTLAGGGVGVGLGGNAAVEIVEDGQSYAMRQYAGALVVAADAAHRVSIEVPNGRVSFSAGQLQISISGAVTRVDVREGSARFTDTRGTETPLAAGHSARAAQAGVIVRDEQGRSIEPTPSGQSGGGNPNAGPGNSNGYGNGGSNPNAGPGNNSGNGGSNPNAGPGNNSGGGNGNGSTGDKSASGNPNAGAGNNNAGGGGNAGGGNPNAGSGNNSGNGGSNPNAGPGNNSGNGNGNGNGNGGGNPNAGAGNNSGNGNGSGQGSSNAGGSPSGNDNAGSGNSNAGGNSGGNNGNGGANGNGNGNNGNGNG